MHISFRITGRAPCFARSLTRSICCLPVLRLPTDHLFQPLSMPSALPVKCRLTTLVYDSQWPKDRDGKVCLAGGLIEPEGEAKVDRGRRTPQQAVCVSFEFARTVKRISRSQLQNTKEAAQYRVLANDVTRHEQRVRINKTIFAAPRLNLWIYTIFL